MIHDCVYILTNESMPGLLKIGKTTRCAEQRAVELFQTGVPTPFIVYEIFQTFDCNQLEEWVHQGMERCRVNPSREFFKADAYSASQYITKLQRSQFQELVSECMGDYSIEPTDCVVGEADVMMAADRLGVQPSIAADILCEASVDELNPAKARMEAKYDERRRARRKSDGRQLMVVVGNG